MIRRALRPLKDAVRREISVLRWRKTPAGRSTIAAFAALKDSQRGKDCILLCNGPSLNKVPFDKLKGRYIIGLNKINLLFDRTTMRPDMIVAINKYVIEQNSEFFNKTEIPLILSRAGNECVTKRSNVNFLNFDDQALFFSERPGHITCEFATVTYSALQIAFHLGFARVAIVGADHSFSQVGKPNELQLSRGPDQNHFDPRYFADGTPWQLADLTNSERAYELARGRFQRNGRLVFNCTEGGNLEVFQRMPLIEFLATNPDFRSQSEAET
ncbi:6-hydroxymethylpterin diphosphokinase MptE-like protein [Paragemmobacter straminiformis]|uniref:DUF115 domain-containing protein n=1 Tax=Paragemmobacter straminiformis TaxID=2045119 RepID=A0A842I7Z9_9RHOB|nr:6-hydroxymethylpterin diphosphokinase MptE-like protein [Gemmobacter straminiformis]MBC2835118.1 DUF115 domain-containing protein [Gemmobacter straminiformis]